MQHVPAIAKISLGCATVAVLWAQTSVSPVTHSVIFDAPAKELNAYTFQLQLPASPSSVAVFRNGMRLKAGVDYNLAGTEVLFFPASAPLVGDTVVIDVNP